MRKNALEQGVGGLEDHKLLELLLFYSIPREDTNELAHRLLNAFGSFDNIISAPPKALMKIEGVGPNTALMLNTVGEVFVRIAKSRHCKKSCYRSTEDLKKLCRSQLENEKTEKLILLCLDGSKRLKKQQVISEGDSLSVEIDMLKTVETVIDCNAAYAVLAHNHPENDENPSASDVDTTRNVALTLRKLGFKLIDHIIVGEMGGVYSMYEDTRFCGMFY